HHSGDIDELVAFLECLIPFKMHASFAFSKDFADSLRFVCTKEDKYNVCLCINLNNSTSVISFNLIDSNSKPEFADFEKIVCDWIESQGEKSQVCYDGNTNVLNWKLDASGINDLKIIELYDLLNQYAVENNIFAFLNIGEFKEEGLPVMRKMGLDNLYVTF
ncbi:MAG: hypothetical protein GX660_11115, partial [Clostridiaceae bacterium]|nr:hypothetical protein [Clostridiaceae bacterium]